MNGLELVMFAVFCPLHGTTILLGPANIERLASGPNGFEVHWHDGAGHRGVWLSRGQPVDGLRQAS